MTNDATTNHGPSARDVEAAVRSVLSEVLSAAPGLGARRPTPVKTGAAEFFAGRLLSLKQAETLPAGLREVRVAPGTVVTPLARDFLKKSGVGIAFGSRAEAEQAGNSGEWGFAIGPSTGLVEAFRRSLLEAGDEWRELGESADDAVRWVAEAGSRGALVLTDESAVAVYRACQVMGVRASAAEDVGAVSKAVRLLGVNLLVVEPAGKSIALLRQMASAYRRQGGPVCPDWALPTGGGCGS